MSFFRSFFAAVLIATIVCNSFGQVVTRSLMYGESLQRSEIHSVTVKSRHSTGKVVTEGVETKIGYAIEDEFLLSGFLPALRTRPAGLIASFYIKVAEDNAVPAEDKPLPEGSLVVECRDPESDRLIWRGVAAAVTELYSTDPYLWEQKLTEAARMLVRRFNEEGLSK